MRSPLPCLLAVLAALTVPAVVRADAPVWSGLRFGRLMAPAVSEATTLRLAGDGGLGRVQGRAAFAGRFGVGLAVPLPGSLALEGMATVVEGSRASSTFSAGGDGRVTLAGAWGPVTAAVGADLFLADGAEGFSATSPFAGALWHDGRWRAAGSVRFDHSDSLPPLQPVAQWAEGLTPGWVAALAAGYRLRAVEGALTWRRVFADGPADRDDLALDVAWTRALPVGRLLLGAWLAVPGVEAPDGRTWTLGARLGLDLALRSTLRELFPADVEPEPAFSPF